MFVLMTASYIEVSMKIWNKVPAGKRKIVGVDDVTDEEEYNKVEDMTPFAVDKYSFSRRGGSVRTS